MQCTDIVLITVYALLVLICMLDSKITLSIDTLSYNNYTTSIITE